MRNVRTALQVDPLSGLRVGDQVRVKGFHTIATIAGFVANRAGAALLNRPVLGEYVWDMQLLVRVTVRPLAASELLHTQRRRK